MLAFKYIMQTSVYNNNVEGLNPFDALNYIVKHLASVSSIVLLENDIAIIVTVTLHDEE